MSVVVGWVPTPEGEAALRAGITWAETLEEHLVVVNTSRGDAAADPRFADESQLAALSSVLDGVPHELLHVIRGRDAAEEILSVAASRRAALLVIGLRRRTPVGKLLMGSTAQRVLLEAECPVLAVKA